MNQQASGNPVVHLLDQINISLLPHIGTSALFSYGTSAVKYVILDTYTYLRRCCAYKSICVNMSRFSVAPWSQLYSVDN